MKTRAFWDITQCRLGGDRRFRGTYSPTIKSMNHLMLKQYAPLKRRSSPMRLHGAISQKALIFVTHVFYNTRDNSITNTKHHTW
jgi:hypothetical protein